MEINVFQKLTFMIKNLPFIRPLIERNRWLVKVYFDRKYGKSDPYMYSSSPFEKEKILKVVKFVDDMEYEKVLDVGCGEGHLLEKLCPISNEMVGVDISEKAIKRAKGRLQRKKAHFQTADILTLELNQKFNLIVCSEVLVYLNLTQIQKVALKLVNWLEPGGRLLLVNVFAKSEARNGLELKRIGAGAIHPLFTEMGMLKTVRAKTYPQYAMLLLQKV